MVVDSSTAAVAHWLVFVSGELDLLSGPPLEACLDRLMSTDGVGLVLDLHGITFVDAYGLRLLVRAAARLGDRLGLQRPSGRVRWVMEVGGVIDLLPILPDDGAWSWESQADSGVRIRLDLCAVAY
jgi:anti-anti-sigma factor